MPTTIRATLPWWWALTLTAAVLLIYAPALNYGLIWDDPRFYQGVQAQTSVIQIFTSPQPPTFQFYRPLATLYNSLLVAPNGVVNAQLAHAVQIAAHLVVVLTLGPVLSGLRLDRAHARLAALLFGVFPLSYFGVAWQQNQQPLMVLGLVLSMLSAQQFAHTQAWRWLVASLIIFASALLVQEGALPFILVFFYIGWLDHQAKPNRRWQWWPLAHMGVGALYTTIWLGMPLARGITGPGLQPIVLGYFTQGVVFPLARLLTPWVIDWAPERLLALFVVLWAALTVGLWRWTSRLIAAFSSVWIGVAILPLWVGLSWNYVSLGPRLLYPATIGIAVLWGGWSAWLFTARGWRRGLGALVLALVLGVSAQQLWQFQRMFLAGTSHLARAVDALSAAPHQRLLFINFPDQYELRPAQYPLGFWGPILAPVVQDLSDYARALRGQSGEDRSLASFVTGHREAFPYQVFMRGVDSLPDQLVQAAQWADMVYLTDYLPDGAFRLRAVGYIHTNGSYTPALARIGDGAELISAEVDPNQPTVRLIWRCLQPLQPNDTIFAHLWQSESFIGGMDGDSLGELVPPAAWPVGAVIVDIRPLPIADLPSGMYEVRVGIYNRASNTRYPTYLPDGSTSEFGAMIGEVRVP